MTRPQPKPPRTYKRRRVRQERFGELVGFGEQPAPIRSLEARTTEGEVEVELAAKVVAAVARQHVKQMREAWDAYEATEGTERDKVEAAVLRYMEQM